jgi:Xaa-Pro aminopeptidase
MDTKILRERHRRIREALVRADVDCLILTRPANVTYVTGFMGEDSWAIVLPKGIVLVTDSRYSEQARQECPGARGCRIIIRKEAMFKAVAKLLRKFRSPPRLARRGSGEAGLKIAVEKSASIADFEGLKKHLKCRIRTTDSIIETARRTKDEKEIAAIRLASKIAGRAFENTRRRIRTGMTENELAGMLDFEIRKSGGQNGFPTIAAFGANASRPHHRPTNRKLRKNDTILIDFGVRYKGYCCDVTRCLTVGRVNRLYDKVYKAVKNAQSAAMNMVKAGVEIKKVDEAARAVLKKEGLPVYGHGTGHGLGLEVHEMPTVSAKSEGTLQAGDVTTIEPGVYMPGRLGVRIEDDVLVTQEGYILLSECCPQLR